MLHVLTVLIAAAVSLWVLLPFTSSTSSCCLLLPAPPRDLHDLSRNGQLRGYIPYTWDSNTWPLKYV
jgi:hypothetical protein